MNTSSSEQGNQTTIRGNVSTSGGDFIARDSNHHGDNIAGDKIVNYGLPQLPPGKGRVTLKIEGDFEQFGAEDKVRVQQIIEQVLGIKIAKAIIFEPGSVHATVELTREEAQKLYEIVKAGQLREYGIVDVVSITLGEASNEAQVLGADARKINPLAITSKLLNIQRSQKNISKIPYVTNAVVRWQQIINWLLMLPFIIVLPRYLGPTDLGKLQFAFSLWTLISVLTAFGMDPLLTKRVAFQPDQVTELFGNALITRLTLYVLGSAILITILHQFNYSLDTLQFIYLVGIVGLVEQSNNICGAVLHGLEKLEVISLAELSSTILYVVTSIALLINGWSSYIIIILLCTRALIKLVIQLLLLSRLHKLPVRFDLHQVYQVLRLLQYGLPILLSSFGLAAYMQVDIIIISALVDERSIGWYSAADRLLNAFLFIPAVYSTALIPILSRTYVDGNQIALQKLISKSFDNLILFGVPFAFCIAILANRLVILLFGNEFANSGPILAVLGIVLVSTYQNIFINRVLTLIGRWNAWMIVTILAFVATIFLDLILIPWCEVRFSNGAIGGALASVVTELGILIAGLKLLPAGSFTRKNVWMAIRVVIAGIIMSAVIWQFKHLFLAIPIMIGAVTYTSLLLLFRVITTTELLNIFDFWARSLDFNPSNSTATVKK